MDGLVYPLCGLGHGAFGDDDLVAVAVWPPAPVSNGMGPVARKGTLASPSVTANVNPDDYDFD